MMVVLTLLLLLPLGVAGRILYLYVQQGEVLRKQARNQIIAWQKIPAMRGNIYDREGRLLVVNTARFDVAVDPLQPGFEQIQHAFLAFMAELTGYSEAYFQKRLRNRSSQRYALLWRNLGEAKKEALERQARKWLKALGRPYGSLRSMGILLEPHFGRKYTYGATAAHVVGYVNTDLEGLAGLELQYNDVLRGEPGMREVQRDRRGYIKAMVGGKEEPPRHGEHVVLTIDLVRQAIMEEELARGVAEMQATWGTAIAMDPETGAIIAMANVPGFHPEHVNRYPTAALRNHAISDKIEPGSTFKLVTAVAAVEQGVVTLEDSIDTGAGWAVFGGRTMKDVHARGKISFAEAIIYSSNVGIARVAHKLDPGVFYQYARNFGFGQPTWIDLPGEVEGSLKKPSEWSRTTQPWMSIGYEVEVTPIQLLSAYAALANGGRLMRPYIVAERRSVTGEVLWRAQPDSIRRVFKPETARQLIPVFEQVVARGTGKRARVPGVRIAGKTGTAQKVVDGRYQRGAYRATFVGFFPVEHPRVVLLVLLDEPKKKYYGGDVAAPIFQRIAQRWIGITPELYASPQEEWKPLFRRVPSVEGLPAYVAAARLFGEGFHVRPLDSWHTEDIVEFQRPEAGDSLEVGGTVRVRMADTPPQEALPSFKGWPLRDAVAFLGMRGIPAIVRGHGRVVRTVTTGKNGTEKSIILVAR